MSKKKAIALLATGYYLGTLDIPEQVRREWKTAAEYGKLAQVISVPITMAVAPIAPPGDYILKKLGLYDRVISRLRIANEQLRFRVSINKYEAEQASEKGEV